VMCWAISPFAGQSPQKWVVVQRLLPPSRTQEPADPSVSTNPPILDAVFFIDHMTGWAVGDSTILRTTDGGRRWTTNMLAFPANLHSVFFHDKLKGWTVGDSEGRGVVLLTEDGGATWRIQRKIEGFQLSGIHNVCFVDENQGWAVGEGQENGSVNGIILTTQNGGQDWRLQYTCAGRCASLNAIKFVDAHRGWAVGSNLILHTVNGGKLWIAQPAEGSDLFDIDFVSPTEGWVVGGKGLLLHTTDGGRLWQSRALSLEYRTLWLSSVRFATALDGWVAGDNGAVFSTHDGGATWELETLGTSPFLRGLAVTSRAIFAVGNDGVILRRVT
jgi:photosystem II stability/assembly factor-like uncharacterized protein